MPKEITSNSCNLIKHRVGHVINSKSVRRDRKKNTINQDHFPSIGDVKLILKGSKTLQPRD